MNEICLKTPIVIHKFKNLISLLCTIFLVQQQNNINPSPWADNIIAACIMHSLDNITPLKSPLLIGHFLTQKKTQWNIWWKFNRLVYKKVYNNTKVIRGIVIGLTLLKKIKAQITDACNLWEKSGYGANFSHRKPKVQTRLWKTIDFLY